MQVVREFRPDALLTSSPSNWVHLLGLGLKRRFNLPWVADFRDPWVTDGTPNQGRSLTLRWQTFWERSVMKRADTIVANAPLALKSIQEVYPQHAHKMVTITNGYDAESFPAVPHRAPNGLVTLLHAGEVSQGRDPRPLLDALQGLGQEQQGLAQKLRVRFLGKVTPTDIAEGFNFPGELERRSLRDTVVVEGRVPYQRVLGDMSSTDILLMLDTPGRRIGIPAKAYEYLGARRPILALAERDGDVAWLLKESGIPHRIAPPREPARIRQALLELVKDVRAGQVALPDKEKLAPFTRERLAQRLAQVLNNCIHHKLN
jgi:glycosyltransferase involved in cell wall biosynthesis